MRNYTRWTEREAEHAAPGTLKPLEADILGAPYTLIADAQFGQVRLDFHPGDTDWRMSPDEARMLGVRLIEAAALADGNRAIRRQPS